MDGSSASQSCCSCNSRWSFKFSLENREYLVGFPAFIGSIRELEVRHAIWVNEEMRDYGATGDRDLEYLIQFCSTDL